MNNDNLEKLKNMFEFHDGEMIIHLDDENSITVPSHIFVNEVLSKLEDYLIFAPYSGKIEWIDSEDSQFKYADSDTHWIDLHYNLYRRNEFKYGVPNFKVARYYPYKPKQSHITLHGKLVSRDVAKQLIYDCSSNIKKNEEELDYILNRLNR